MVGISYASTIVYVNTGAPSQRIKIRTHGSTSILLVEQRDSMARASFDGPLDRSDYSNPYYLAGAALTSVNVRYTRQQGDATVEGSVRLLLTEDADWPREWTIVYAALKQTVDAAFTGNTRPASETPEAVGSPDAPDATPEVSQPSETVNPGERVQYTGCRVMFNPNYLPEEGKRREQVRMRIGNKEQIRVGTPPGYVNAKSTDPEMIKLIQQYRKGDMINIEGTFEEPWQKRTPDGTTVSEWDLVVESISRA